MLLHIVLVFKNIFSHNVEILYYFQNPTQDYSVEKQCQMCENDLFVGDNFK